MIKDSNSGQLESTRGSQAYSDSESINITGVPSMIENFQINNEISLSHKTKVSQVKPPSRIVYEWEWDIPKFDRAYPFLAATENFSIVEKIKILKSEKITAGEDIKRKCDWYFLLSECNGKLSWHLQLGKIHKWNSLKEKILVAFSFKIVDTNGKELIQKKRCFKDFQEHVKCGWDDIIELEKLYERRDAFLADNVLRTKIMLEMYNDLNQWHDEDIKKERDDFTKLMTSDMWRLRRATGTADAHLECDGRVFPVHKLILSARSGAFSKMFGTPVSPKAGHSQDYSASTTAGGDNPPPGKEQLVSSISVNDVDATILEIVLDYIYSGNVKPLTSPQILSGVIRAADKFELTDLKSFCFNALMKDFVTEENFGNLAVLAFRHSAHQNVRMQINGYCLRNITNLMRRKTFRDALKMEPDAFFPDADN